MKFPRIRQSAAAFTMIEIALALAIIGFSLVAIIGTLPQGIDVQRDNRRETIINQDANYLLEAIRTGSASDDLANYVAAITISSNSVSRSYLNPNTIFASFPLPQLTNIQSFQLTSGSNILGLLSTPEWVNNNNSNYVVAYVQALSGAANEKSPQNNSLIREASFSYRLVVENVPYAGNFDLKTNYFFDPSLVNWGNPTNAAQTNFLRIVTNLNTNFHDVRLLFRWPLQPGGSVGSGRQNYRMMVGGVLTNYPPNFYVPSRWYFQPQLFSK